MRKHCWLICVVILFIASVQSKGAPQADLRLLLPRMIYAVPGHELNIYFDNIVLAASLNDYIFDVGGQYGRHYQARWSYIPEENDLYEFPLKITVLDGDNAIRAEGNTTVIVSPVDAGSGRKISLLLIGDSLTDNSVYPNELNRLLQQPENPKVTFIGSHTGGGKQQTPEKVLHEGRGGWTWAGCCLRFTEGNEYRARSPFLFMKNNKPQLDFKRYLEEKNKGAAPDFIVIFLGCNDVFFGNENKDDKHYIEKTIDITFKYSDMLLEEIRRVCPDTKIGLILPIPSASSQDGFSRAGSKQNRWQYRRNQHRLVERMLGKYGDREKENISLIPAYLNIDCANNFPADPEPISARNDKKVIRQSNSVHPAREGYLQIADSVYYWIKYQLSQTD